MDVVVGDAFSGISVPWHLTTREFLEDVRAVLAPGGLYVMNLIDYDHYELARAEAKTFQSVFNDVAVIAPNFVLADSNGVGSNVLLIGGDHLPKASVLNEMLHRTRSASLAVTGVELSSFIADASELTDEFAPVDQLLGRP